MTADEFADLCEKVEQASHDAQNAAFRGDWQRAAVEIQAARFLAGDAEKLAKKLAKAAAKVNP